MSKRPRLDEKHPSGEPTDYDKKLQSFIVWDPLKTVEDVVVKDVFETKKLEKENSRQIANISPSKPHQITNHNNEIVIGLDKETLNSTKENSILNTTNNNNNNPVDKNTGCNTEENLGVDTECNIPAVDTEINSLDMKKSVLLQQKYGQITVLPGDEEAVESTISVVIDICGYEFEGVSTSKV